MTALDDLEMLRRFARGGDESAFESLVSRHAGLVYSAASRISGGNPAQAQDISQQVFSHLAARGADVLVRAESNRAAQPPESIATPPSLAGWFHSQTRFEALEFLRKEGRRRRREQEFATQTAVESMNPDPDWSRIRPWLDEALAQLETADREALLLRFFQGKKYGSVGEALGSSEEAARKRIHRALERLQTLLTARGIGTTASALAILCEAHGTATLPSGFAERLARVSLAAKATPVDLSPTARPATPGVTPVTLKLVLGGAGVGLVLIAGYFTRHLPWQISPSNPSASAENRASSGDTGPRLPSDPRLGDPLDSGRKVVPDAEVEAILERLRSALYASSSRPARIMPDPTIKAVIDDWQGPRNIFLPLLREALADSRPMVVVRAAAGVAILGPDARDTGPELLRALQSNTSGHTLMGLGNALAQLGPEPALLPGLVDALRNKPQHGLGLAEGFSSLAGGDLQLLRSTLTPLLRDPKPRVQEVAAYALSRHSTEPRSPEILRIALNALTSEDLNSQHLGLEVIRKAAAEPAGPRPTISAKQLGGAADDAVAALIQVANHSQLAERRSRARHLLDQLEPELRRENPDFDRWLAEQKAATEFHRRVAAGSASLDELVDGLNRHPGEAAVAAEALVRLGTKAVPALPALHRALAQLQPPPGVSSYDRARLVRDRARIAQSIQRLAPDQPKPLFTQEDIQSIFGPLGSNESTAAQATLDALRKALLPLFQDSLVQGDELQPDQLRAVLEAVRSVDPGMRESLVAEILKIDPRFQPSPTPTPNAPAR